MAVNLAECSKCEHVRCEWTQRVILMFAIHLRASVLAKVPKSSAGKRTQPTCELWRLRCRHFACLRESGGHKKVSVSWGVVVSRHGSERRALKRSKLTGMLSLHAINRQSSILPDYGVTSPFLHSRWLLLRHVTRAFGWGNISSPEHSIVSIPPSCKPGVEMHGLTSNTSLQYAEKNLGLTP